FEGVHVVDLKTKKEIWSLKITAESIFDMKVYQNQLFVGTGGGVIVVVDIEERSLVKHIKISDASVRVFSVDKEKKHLAIGTSDHSIKVISLTDFTPLANLKGHTNSV